MFLTLEANKGAIQKVATRAFIHVLLSGAYLAQLFLVGRNGCFDLLLLRLNDRFKLSYW